jgi:hypothetical protein
MTPIAIKLAAAGLALALASPAFAQSRAQPRPPAQIAIHNLRAAPLTVFEIATTGEQPRLVGKITRPLAPGARTTVRLSRPAGCEYYVMARFADDAESDAESMDLCRDRSIRLTE